MRRTREAISEALSSGQDFVKIENPETGKFVQLAIFRDKRLIVMDIPLIELSDPQLEKLREMLDAEVARDAQSDEPISVQKMFDYGDLKGIPRIVENIFSTVFCLAQGHVVVAEIFPR